MQHVRVGWEGADLLAEGKGGHQQGGGVRHHWTGVVCDTLNHGIRSPPALSSLLLISRLICSALKSSPGQLEEN